MSLFIKLITQKHLLAGRKKSDCAVIYLEDVAWTFFSCHGEGCTMVASYMFVSTMNLYISYNFLYRSHSMILFS